jgi:hypothetical protein
MQLARRHFPRQSGIMFESTGEITDVQEFSDTDDQVAIKIKIPSPLGEEGETHSSDLVLPKGSAKVGDIVSIVI